MFAVATFLLWGTNNFIMGYAEKTHDMDPRYFTATMWVTIGSLGVVLFAYLRMTGQAVSFDNKLIFPIVCGALLGIGILTFSYAMSQPDMETGATAAVATSNVVLTAGLAFVLLKEDLSLQQWPGIGTVVLGIILLQV